MHQVFLSKFNPLFTLTALLLYILNTVVWESSSNAFSQEIATDTRPFHTKIKHDIQDFFLPKINHYKWLAAKQQGSLKEELKGDTYGQHFLDCITRSSKSTNIEDYFPDRLGVNSTNFTTEIARILSDRINPQDFRKGSKGFNHVTFAENLLNEVWRIIQDLNENTVSQLYSEFEPQFSSCFKPKLDSKVETDKYYDFLDLYLNSFQSKEMATSIRLLAIPALHLIMDAYVHNQNEPFWLALDDLNKMTQKQIADEKLRVQNILEDSRQEDLSLTPTDIHDFDELNATISKLNTTSKNPELIIFSQKVYSETIEAYLPSKQELKDDLKSVIRKYLYQRHYRPLLEKLL